MRASTENTAVKIAIIRSGWITAQAAPSTVCRYRTLMRCALSV